LGLDLDVIFVDYLVSDIFSEEKSIALGGQLLKSEIKIEKRILVSKAKDDLDVLDKFFDGYLISKNKFLDHFDAPNYINYF
jgi:hypothetical protein